jgi:hypothetical protein
MALQIFVEDQLAETYEVLARRAFGAQKPIHARIKASRIDVPDFLSRDGLLDLLERAVRSGFDCVMFILDEEALPDSPERPAQLGKFREAFRQLCHHLGMLPNSDPIRRARVVRVVCRRCLECWLLADPRAVVDSARGLRGLTFDPRGQATDDLSPHEAGKKIEHLFHEVGRRLDRRDLRSVSLRGVKSRGKSIAEHLDTGRARRHNRSLAYFFDMVDCHISGCERPFPERE